MPVFHGYAVGDMSFFSIMLNVPQTFCSIQTALKAATSGPDKVHIISGSIDIERPWMLYSGKRMRSVWGYARFVWRTREQMCCVALARSSGVVTRNNWDWIAAMTIPPFVLFNPPRPLILTDFNHWKEEIERRV